MRKPTSLSIDEAVMEKVDAQRGSLSRSRFVEVVLERALAGRGRGDPLAAVTAARSSQDAKRAVRPRPKTKP